MSLLVFHIFIITYFSIPCLDCLGINMLGPADVIYNSFEYCETKITDIDIWITTKKYNRTTNVLDITLISPWAIDDDVTLNLTAEVKKQGGYKPGQFHMKDTMCKVFNTILGDIFTQLLQAANLNKCPIPEGKYDIKNFYLDNKKMTVPQLYGEYRALLQFYRDGEIKGCYFAFIEMVPKKE